MNDLLFLAAAYLKRNWGKSLTLLACLGVCVFLPLTVSGLVGLFEREMGSRAENTPLVLGREGSRFDLVLHALHFTAEAPGTVGNAVKEDLMAEGLARVVPLFAGQTARGYPVVATTLDYFDFRELSVAEGTPPLFLGDCVVGAEVAAALGLAPGDRLFTDPENVFNLAGAQPVNLRITGVLAPTGSSDDRAVFTHLMTGWLVAGFGHGHEDVVGGDAAPNVIEEAAGNVTVGAAIGMHLEVTRENIDTFHRHGDDRLLPLTALLLEPVDDRAAAILRGRFDASADGLQILRPTTVVGELLGMVARIKQFFDLHHVFLIAISAAFLLLVFILSARLRRAEFATMSDLGASRGSVAALQVIELLVLLALGTLLAVAASRTVLHFASGWTALAGG